MINQRGGRDGPAGTNLVFPAALVLLPTTSDDAELALAWAVTGMGFDAMK
jgi:hypothetical protein